MLLHMMLQRLALFFCPHPPVLGNCVELAVLLAVQFNGLVVQVRDKFGVDFRGIAVVQN